MMRLPMGLRIYRLVSILLSPLVPMLLRQRLLRGKEDAQRLPERLGQASLPRPDGELIWVHGASVGESMAALPLLETLHRQGRTLLVTSGTTTSARIMAQRLPGLALHQFAVVDTPSSVRRFLDHWRPQAALFVDSEIWPNVIIEAKRRGVKLALINGRMSERSFKSWSRAKTSARALLSAYDLCLAQDARTAMRLTSLGAKDVVVTGSLKADAPPLPADPAALAALAHAIAGRPLFLAAQTHPGEEELLLPVHDSLRRTHRDLLTIIAPRHPARGAQIAALCGSRPLVLRSTGALPTADTMIYLADTIGELGLFYRLAPFAFVGGSLVAHGGQNPLEPARLGCAVMAGPHTENFADAYGAIFAMQGEGRISTADAIATLADRLLADPQAAKTMAMQAEKGALALAGAVTQTQAAVERMLGHARA